MSAVLTMIGAATSAISVFRWAVVFWLARTAIKASSDDGQRRETALEVLRLVLSGKDSSAEDPSGDRQVSS
ncbi:hypothetical protein AB0J82_20970 [Asanoa sp. NPDC049518]|uniref:hypothetical protein n=1 Tax=unclassified Asanoa TaxID=2685164 RepID=UPI0034474FA5